jgi:hypothetical protein
MSPQPSFTLPNLAGPDEIPCTQEARLQRVKKYVRQGMQIFWGVKELRMFASGDVKNK